MNNESINQPNDISRYPIVPSNRIIFDILKNTPGSPGGVDVYQLPVSLNNVSVYDYGSLSSIICYIINASVESDSGKYDFYFYLSYQQVFGSSNLQDILILQVRNALCEKNEPVLIMISQSYPQPALAAVQVIQRFIISFQTIPERVLPGFSFVYDPSQKYEYSMPLNLEMKNAVISDYYGNYKTLNPSMPTCVVNFNYSKNNISNVIQWISCVKDPDKRRFIFLYYHLCYMASLLIGSIKDFAIVIDTGRELGMYFLKYLVGSNRGLEYIDMEDTENNIASIYRETKDIPFVLSIENAASVRKCESIINKLLKSNNKSNIGSNFFQAVPIIFSSGY